MCPPGAELEADVGDAPPPPHPPVRVRACSSFGFAALLVHAGARSAARAQQPPVRCRRPSPILAAVFGWPE
eukprot:1416167-Alexandrium_andersonii.AAC.1